MTYKKGNATTWSSNNLPAHLPSTLLAWMCVCVCVCVCVCSRVGLCDPVDYNLSGFSVHGIFPGKNTGVGCHFLLQGIFPAQTSNGVSCIGRQILFRWATREAQLFRKSLFKSCLLKSPLNLTFLIWNVKITALHPVDCWKCTIHEEGNHMCLLKLKLNEM